MMLFFALRYDVFTLTGGPKGIRDVVQTYHEDEDDEVS
jgi:hypothetical protein